MSRTRFSHRALLALPFLGVAGVALVAAACASSPPSAARAAPLAAPPPAATVSAAQVTSPPAPLPPAAEPVPQTVRDLQHAILSNHDAADGVQSLTTEVGARLAGSPGDKLAVAWALKAMKERGLVNVHAEPVKVPVWQRGVETASIVAPVAHSLAVTALGWSGATPAKGVEGDVVRFDSLDALKGAADKSLAGKIAFLDVRMVATPEGPGYGKAVVNRAFGPAEAKKKGALALVIRSISGDDSRFPHTGSTHVDKDDKSPLAAGALSNADADLLERLLAAHGSARLHLTLTPRKLPDADSANVVGEVPGREAPNEVIVIGAHLDSWDLGEGAIDDGAGCGIVLEAGKALAALPTKPRRTVRVVLFAAEENSLSGGTAYAKAHEAEKASHVAAIEADLGTNKVVHLGFFGSKEGRGRLFTLAPLLEPLGVTTTEEEGHGGADIGPLGALGVPLVDLEQDPGRYFDTHHTANDTFERVDADALSQAAAAFATTAWGLAEMKEDLGRVPNEMTKPSYR
jgi:hypothetical protein